MESMGNDGFVPATRADLDDLRGDFGVLRSDFDGLRSEFGTLRTEVKADIGRLDAKIDSAVRRLAKEIVGVQTGLGELNAKFDKVSTKEDIQRFIDAVDRFAGKAQSYDAAKVLHGQVLTDVQIQMKDHERRIKDLEDRPH